MSTSEPIQLADHHMPIKRQHVHDWWASHRRSLYICAYCRGDWPCEGIKAKALKDALKKALREHPYHEACPQCWARFQRAIKQADRIQANLDTEMAYTLYLEGRLAKQTEKADREYHAAELSVRALVTATERAEKAEATLAELQAEVETLKRILHNRDKSVRELELENCRLGSESFESEERERLKDEVIAKTAVHVSWNNYDKGDLWYECSFCGASAVTPGPQVEAPVLDHKDWCLVPRVLKGQPA